MSAMTPKPFSWIAEQTCTALAPHNNAFTAASPSCTPVDTATSSCGRAVEQSATLRRTLRNSAGSLNGLPLTNAMRSTSISGSKKRLNITTPRAPRASSESATASTLVRRIGSFTDTGIFTAAATRRTTSAYSCSNSCAVRWRSVGCRKMFSSRAAAPAASMATA